VPDGYLDMVAGERRLLEYAGVSTQQIVAAATKIVRSAS
jgi:hypothetical protein